MPQVTQAPKKDALMKAFQEEHPGTYERIMQEGAARAASTAPVTPAMRIAESKKNRFYADGTAFGSGDGSSRFAQGIAAAVAKLQTPRPA